MIIRRFIAKLVPGKTLSTIFGIGLLPTWQRHWGTLFATLFIAVELWIVLNGTGVNILNLHSLSNTVYIASILMSTAIIIYVISIPMIASYQTFDNTDTDSIIIEVVAGYIALIALSLITLIYIRDFINRIAISGLCTIMPCPFWLSGALNTIAPIALPFAVYRYFDSWKIWPSSFFISGLSTVTGRISDTLTSVIYGSFTLYFISFTICDLPAAQATDFIVMLTHATLARLTAITVITYNWLVHIDIKTIAETLGITGLMDTLGIVNAPVQPDN